VTRNTVASGAVQKCLLKHLTKNTTDEIIEALTRCKIYGPGIKTDSSIFVKYSEWLISFLVIIFLARNFSC